MIPAEDNLIDTEYRLGAELPAWIRKRRAGDRRRGCMTIRADRHERHNVKKGATVKAHIGDRLVYEGTHVGDHRRVGVITEVPHADGSPPFRVRWFDDDHTALVFPGPDAHIEPGNADETAPEH